MKHIDSDKLIAEIDRQQRRLILLSNTERVDIRRDCALQNGVYNYILDLITSLQEEPQEVDLDREIIRYKVPFTDESEYLNETTLDAIARHFYELGQRTKYQQDRAEFAKLKAKEWQDGYNEGYAKGFNARKE